MHSRQPFSGFRLVKRRLQVVKRPAVWGTALILSATVIVFMDYWRGYSRSNLARQNTSTETLDLEDPNLLLSDEDRAIAADIDTVPLLLNDFSGPETGASAEPEASPTASPSSLPSPLPSILPGFPQQSETGDRADPQNPFSPPTLGVQPPPSIGAAPLVLRSPSAPPSAPTGVVAPPPAVIVPSAPTGSNPLQDAMQQYRRSIPLGNTRGLPVGTVLPSLPATPSLPANSGVGVPEIDSDPYRIPAQTSPPLGTTGYTQPSTLQVSPSPSEASSMPMQLPESSFASPSPQRSIPLPPLAKP